MSVWSPVKLQIHSVADGENVIQHVVGEALRKGTALYIRYEEEEQQTGSESIRNTVKITGDSVKLIRHGGVESEQTFELGKRLPGFYRSPFTSFALSTDTKELTLAVSNLSGKISFSYDLYVFEEQSGQLSISIEIQEEQ
ncbi:DUF1934 domain-containing protein [Paenibacillus sp. Marseille-Q4541]|uniref:DUF1934 domain-containing protein n=1 Tax=Paenibacillus sp. Marseille-Q4541 TaxID=2831522 RepID=UPI001BAABB5D|nr:DUF1934 domain-containing protein [Paenibacillus sp. Marseille-Q4541]